MLSNISKLFKKGASSPSSKDRANPFGGSENSGTKGRGSSRGGSQSGSRKRSGKQDGYSNEDVAPNSFGEHLQPGNGVYANGHSPASPRVMGFDDSFLDDRSGTSSPGHHPYVNGRPVTDPKVLQLLGATESDENVIAEWLTVKEDVSSEFSHRHDEETEEDGSSPDTGEGLWPQKSELPPSFEFARPTGQPLSEDNDPGDGILYPDTGTTSSPSRLEADSHHQPNRSHGEESSPENETATGSEEDNSVDSADVHPRPRSRAPPLLQTFRASSPKPSVDYSSPSPRTTPQDRSWGSNVSPRPEVSWGSTNGSVSPRWGGVGGFSGLPSPERVNHPVHPLPPPPASPSPKLHPILPPWGAVRVDNPGVSRDWQGLPLSNKVPQSPSHHRTPLRSHLSPLVSPLPSPPRSPISSSRPAFPPGSWSPLPTPPISSHSHSPYQSPPRSPSRVPRTLTKWKKIKQIGVGSFGTVHEAINLDDGSFFAVKVSHDESIPAEIHKEIEVLSMLRHPNVVQYFGTAMEDGHLCIFLELMQNSLQSIIKVFHHFDETLISTYTRQILQGLEYLHRKSTIHRDIKCANILVDKDGQVKLADFGLAKEVGLSLATSCKGTPYFMAPEILKPHSINKRGYGLPVDIWSLGCTVLEMADGQPPWSFLQGFSFFFKLNKGELPPIPQHLSYNCQDFIKKCLQFRPEDRPTASQLLLHPFVANAPATAAAAAFVSPSPAAMYMRSTLAEAPQGRNGEGQQTRNGQASKDYQGSGPNSPHHRFDSQQPRPDSQHNRPDSHHRPDSQHNRPESHHDRSDSPHHRHGSHHHRPILQRSARLDRSLNRSSSHPITGTHELPDTPRSPSSEAASSRGHHHGW